MTRHDKTMMGLALCAAFRHKYAEPWLPRTVMAILMQCSTEAVRQIEDRALRKIRRAMSPDDCGLAQLHLSGGQNRRATRTIERMRSLSCQTPKI